MSLRARLLPRRTGGRRLVIPSARRLRPSKTPGVALPSQADARRGAASRGDVGNDVDPHPVPLSSADGGAAAGPTPRSANASCRSLTVMTLNVWNSNQWLERRPAVAAWIDEVRPDLVALQEIERTSTHCQATWLAQQTGMEAVFGPARRSPECEFGNAVLSRLPVGDVRVRALTDGGSGSEPRCALTVDVKAPHGMVSFTVTHLAHRDDEGWLRQAQVLELAELINESTGAFPSILCGDLNARPDSTEVRFLKGLESIGGRGIHLVDAFESAHAGDPGYTWDNRNPYTASHAISDQRIDYILVGAPAPTGAGQVLSASVVCDEPRADEWPSDHFGVVARLSWGCACA